MRLLGALPVGAIAGLTVGDKVVKGPKQGNAVSLMLTNLGRLKVGEVSQSTFAFF